MSSLALTDQEREIVREILASHVPGVRALAFGSRVTGRARRWSDLDLMLLPPSPLPHRTLDDLREAFMESDLSIRVDVVDGARADEEFRAVALRKTAEIV